MVHGERVRDPSGQEAELDEPLGEHAPHRVVDGLEAVTRPDRNQARRLRAQHELVDRALRPGEPPVHGEGAGDVGGVVPPLAPGVDQQQVAVRHPPAVLGVVQDAGVGPGGDDRGVAGARGAVGPEHELERRLHLVLVLARPRVAHGLGVRLAADLARAALPGEFAGRPTQAHLVHDGSRVLDRRGRDLAPAPRRPPLGEQSRDPAVEGRVAETIHERRPVEDVLAETPVQLVDRVGGVGAVVGDGALHPRPSPVPDLPLAVARAHEQDVALLGVGGVDDRDGVGLLEAGEEEEVGVLTELVRDVAVAEHLPRARDDREAVADGVGEALAAFHERGEVLGGGHAGAPAGGRSTARATRAVARIAVPRPGPAPAARRVMARPSARGGSPPPRTRRPTPSGPHRP